LIKQSLKSMALKGVFWSTIDKFFAQIVQFAIVIILARILMPADFGLIGMLSIFIVLSQTLVDSGLGTGLIQKKNRTDVDFSTVFVFNLVTSVFLYFLLFLSAPAIADFYELPQLVSLTRVLAINIIINSLAVVQYSKLTISVDFKTIAKVNIISVVLGGLIAVYFAYFGFGVWALVIQQITRSFISVLMFWFLSKWKPSVFFSKQSFKNLFDFGYKLLLARIYAQVLNNIYNIIIGKVYSSSELGYYTNAKNYSDITAGTITGILQQVTFPILASLQDDKKRLISVYSRIIRMTAFFVFPTMTLLALLADPFIRLVLTEKWLPAVVLLQWLSFARIVSPISSVNMNILNAVGRSDLFLKVDLSKLPLIVITLIITIPLGVKAMVIGNFIISIISFYINAYMPGKLFGYGALSQLKDILPVFISTVIMAFIVILTTFFMQNLYFKLIVGIFSGVISYLTISSILKMEELNELKSNFKKFISNN
tara:strand:- start:894 stop:2342 length:1449 start_codon:yes stop_codon:yes gene_type:complete